MAISFDGTGDRYAADAPYDWGIGTGDFTVNLWLQPEVTAEAESWLFSMEERPLILRVLAGAWKVTWGGSTYTFNTTLAAATAYWLCLRRSSGTLAAWINGAQEAATSASVTHDTFTSTPSVGHKMPTALGGSQWFTGDVGELAVWNRALAVAEIVSLHQGRVATHFPTDLQCYVPMRTWGDVRDFCQPITWTKSGNPGLTVHPSVIPLLATPPTFTVGSKDDSTGPGPDRVYQQALYELLNGDWDFENDPFYMVLVTGGADFNANHLTLGEVLAANPEFSAYTPQDLAAGTFAMSGGQVTVAATTTVDFGTPAVGNSPLRAAVLCQGTVAGKADSDPPVAWFESNISGIVTDGSALTLTWYLSMFQFGNGSTSDKYYDVTLEGIGNGDFVWNAETVAGNIYARLICGPKSTVQDVTHTTGAQVFASGGLTEYSGTGYNVRTLPAMVALAPLAEGAAKARIIPNAFTTTDDYELYWTNLFPNVSGPIRAVLLQRTTSPPATNIADPVVAWIDTNIAKTMAGENLWVNGHGAAERSRYMAVSWPYLFGSLRSYTPPVVG